MEMLTKKAQIKARMAAVSDLLRRGDWEQAVERVENELLSCKVRFPLLEFAADSCWPDASPEIVFPFCMKIAENGSIGGNVWIGIWLRNSLSTGNMEALHQAAACIAAGNEWYVTDIIGERVFGYGLLHRFDHTLRFLRQLAENANPFVVRAIGPGIHLALKRGLSREPATETFRLLLSLSRAKDGQIQRGIGWAAKTTAKFHPGIIEMYAEEIARAGGWFRRKVKIGLERNAHARGN